MNPFYQRAHFLTAASQINQTPPDLGCEVAFAGRSNAGKSSAINVICHQKSLARTSKTPGRTQQLIFFELDQNHRLVDLPGYGYAKVPLAIQREWQQHVTLYLERRCSLKGIVIVMDSRRPLTDLDYQMIDWSLRGERSLLLLLTKADKLKSQAARTTLQTVTRAVNNYIDRVEVILFSALRYQGIEEVQKILDRWLDISN